MFPGGELLTFGYLRKLQDTLDLNVPRDVATITTEFVGLCLPWFSDIIDRCFQKDGELSITKQQWTTMTELDLRVIQDQVLFRHSNIYDRYGIVFVDPKSEPRPKKLKPQPKTMKTSGIPLEVHTIVCECQFGMKGMVWLSGIIAHSKTLTNLTLSNNQLNDQCIAVLIEALSRNPLKTLTWLDISDNKQVTDESTQMLVEKLLPWYSLTGINFNATGISDRSCDFLLTFYRSESNAQKLSRLSLLKMDANKGLTETKKMK